MMTLADKTCQIYPKGTSAMALAEARALLTQLNGWSIDESSQTINRIYKFKNFYDTMAFVNAIAWVAHQEDHHPDLTISYQTCGVSYSTHDVSGLSENDFICAAKIDRLIARRI